MADSYENGNELSGFIKCWNIFSTWATGGFSEMTQQHEVNQLVMTQNHFVHNFLQSKITLPIF